MLRTWNLLTAFCLLSVSYSSFAFESWEHKQLSDLAFHIAKRVYCDGPVAKSSDTRGKTCHDVESYFANDLPERTKLKSTYGKHTYGDIVMCVDYFLTPEKLLAGTATKPILDSRNINNHPQDGALPKTPEELNLNVIKGCKDSIWNYAAQQAMHSNHAHFQSELVVSQKIYHTLALTLHADEENLYGGLLVNAISDHYLNDFFAPGHITTLRSHLTDVASNSFHDKANRDGLQLFYSAEKFEQQLCRLWAIYSGKTGCPGANDIMFIADGSERQYFLAVMQPEDQREGLLGNLKWPTKNSCAGGCVQNGEATEDIRTLDLLSFIKKYTLSDVTCRKNGESDKECSVRLLGDARLWGKTQTSQRAMMLISQVNSILDILDAKRGMGGVTNTFQKAQWFLRFDEGSPKEGERIKSYSTTASLDGVGNYNIQTMLPLPTSPSTAVIDQITPSYDPIIGIGFSNEMMNFGDRVARTGITLEGVIPIRTDLNDVNQKNFGLAMGLERFHEGPSWGYGLSLRPLMVFPQTETTISLPIRWLKYDDAYDTQWKPSGGVRVDQGFSSFISVYIQYNLIDYARQNDGSLRQGTSMGAGLQLIAPYCRIPLLGKMCP